MSQEREISHPVAARRSDRISIPILAELALFHTVGQGDHRRAAVPGKTRGRFSTPHFSQT